MEKRLYFLDTNAFSYLQQRKAEYVEGFSKLPLENVFLPDVAYDEVLDGLLNPESSRTDNQKAEIARALEDIELVPETQKSLRIEREIRADIERRPITIDDADIKIAAIAMASGATLITENVKHLGRVRGLEIRAFFTTSQLKLEGIRELHHVAEEKISVIERDYEEGDISEQDQIEAVKKILNQMDDAIGKTIKSVNKREAARLAGK